MARHVVHHLGLAQIADAVEAERDDSEQRAKGFSGAVQMDHEGGDAKGGDGDRPERDQFG